MYGEYCVCLCTCDCVYKSCMYVRRLRLVCVGVRENGQVNAYVLPLGHGHECNPIVLFLLPIYRDVIGTSQLNFLTTNIIISVIFI